MGESQAAQVVILSSTYPGVLGPWGGRRNQMLLVGAIFIELHVVKSPQASYLISFHMQFGTNDKGS